MRFVFFHLNSDFFFSLTIFSSRCNRKLGEEIEEHEQGGFLGESTIPAGDGGFIQAGDPGRRFQQIHILSRQKKSHQWAAFDGAHPENEEYKEDSSCSCQVRLFPCFTPRAALLVLIKGLDRASRQCWSHHRWKGSQNPAAVAL